MLGYIDLSKRRVSPGDLAKAELKWNKSKVVHSILRNVAGKCHIPIEQLYQTLAWPLYRRFGHAFDAFKLFLRSVVLMSCVLGVCSFFCIYRVCSLLPSVCVIAVCSSPDKIPELAALSSDVREVLMKHVRKRLTPQPIKLRADIEITCYAYEGIEAIRESLKAGMQFSTPQLPIQVCYHLFHECRL